jgi:hypothetical protein
MRLAQTRGWAYFSLTLIMVIRKNFFGVGEFSIIWKDPIGHGDLRISTGREARFL